MSEAAVQEILNRIQQLPEEDRRLFEERWADLTEAEWRRAAEVARGLARQQGLDQAAIDRAVQEVRYPA